jgi:hypothetical protein
LDGKYCSVHQVRHAIGIWSHDAHARSPGGAQHFSFGVAATFTELTESLGWQDYGAHSCRRALFNRRQGALFVERHNGHVNGVSYGRQIRHARNTINIVSIGIYREDLAPVVVSLE